MKHWSLSTKIILLAMLPTLFLSIFFTIFFLTQRNIDLDKSLERLAYSTIIQLSPAVKQAIKTNEFSLLQQLASASLENPDLVAVAIYNHNKQLISFSGPDRLLSKTPNAPPQDGILTFIQPLAIQKLKSSHSSNSAALPTTEHIGWISVKIATAHYDLLKRQALFIALTILMLGLVISGLIIRWLNRSIVSPIAKILEFAKQTHQGHYNYQAPRFRSLEYQQLIEILEYIRVKLHAHQTDFDENLELQAKDLKQNLEEIELKNIDLGIALKKAQRDSRKKSEFIASLSHEIRTPMSSIIGFSNLLLDTEINKFQKDYLDTIKKSVNTLLSIINDILDFSKIESGKFQLDSIPLDFTEVVEETLISLAPEVYQKRLELIHLIDPNIPRKLIGDPVRLKQIMTNLVFNSIKFTETGSVSIKAKFLEETDSEAIIQISIIDTGIGLSEKDKNNLFKAFTQADISSARKFGGTGLGLVISKQLVEQMQGDIDVHSQSGVGTTICFTIRLQTLKNNDGQIYKARKINKNVLVYETHLLSRQSLKQILSPCLSQVQVVDTIKKLFESLANPPMNVDMPFNMVIISLQHDDLHNHLIKDAITKIRSQYKIPVLALINTAEQEIIRQLLANGVSNCISKPISSKRIVDAIEQEYCLTAIPTVLKLAEPMVTYHDLNILIAEDNPANLKLIASLMGMLHIKATETINGQEAIDAAQQQTFDLIFLDLQMPQKNGIEAAEQIRKNAPNNEHTPIIALSAYIDDNDKDIMYAAGFNEFLTKPISVDKLKEVLRRWSYKAKDLLDSAPKSVNHNASSQTQAHAIDFAYSKSLAGNNAELAREMLTMLQTEIPSYQHQTQDLFNAPDWRALQELVHKIHGSAAFCGAKNLQQAAFAFEEAIKNQAKQDYTELHEQLQTELKRVQIFLAEFLQ